MLKRFNNIVKREINSARGRGRGLGRATLPDFSSPLPVDVAPMHHFGFPPWFGLLPAHAVSPAAGQPCIAAQDWATTLSSCTNWCRWPIDGARRLGGPVGAAREPRSGVFERGAVAFCPYKPLQCPQAAHSNVAVTRWICGRAGSA